MQESAQESCSAALPLFSHSKILLGDSKMKPKCPLMALHKLAEGTTVPWLVRMATGKEQWFMRHVQLRSGQFRCVFMELKIKMCSSRLELV